MIFRFGNCFIQSFNRDVDRSMSLAIRMQEWKGKHCYTSQKTVYIDSVSIEQYMQRKHFEMVKFVPVPLTVLLKNEFFFDVLFETIYIKLYMKSVKNLIIRFLLKSIYVG